MTSGPSNSSAAISPVPQESEDVCSPEDGSPSIHPRVEVTYYTDPLCAWSWALEHAWRRLRFEYGNQIRCCYRMAGLLPGWDRFHDPVQEITRPAQMAPLWLQVSEMTGAPLDGRVWTLDPPASSMPACLAVKAAEQQGPWAAEAYLRRTREAVMLQRRNVARRSVLGEIAQEAAGDLPPDLPFDVENWERAMQEETTRDALRDDLQHLRYYEITRYPAITFRCPAGRPIICIGYRDYSSLRDAVHRVAPGIRPCRSVTLAEYARYWGRLTRHELSSALEMEPDAARRLARQAAERGELGGVEILC